MDDQLVTGVVVEGLDPQRVAQLALGPATMAMTANWSPARTGSSAYPACTTVVHRPSLPTSGAGHRRYQSLSNESSGCISKKRRSPSDVRNPPEAPLDGEPAVTGQAHPGHHSQEVDDRAHRRGDLDQPREPVPPGQTLYRGYWLEHDATL
jgi:hypothetical protein